MGCDCFRNQHIFEGGALAGNFEPTVMVAAFVFVVQVDQQLFHACVLIDDLFGQDEDTTVGHAFVDFPDHRLAFLDVEELQRVVQHHH